MVSVYRAMYTCVCERERETGAVWQREFQPDRGSIAAKLEKNIRFLIETTLRENLPLLLPRPFTFANGVKTGVHSPPTLDLFPPSGITIFRLSPRKRFLIARFNAFPPRV